MQFSLMTYNLLFNKALTKVEGVLKESIPDIICFQEMKTTDEDLKQMERFGYQLADFSNSFIKFGRIYGLATFYKPELFEFHESQTLSLPRTYYEVLLFILNGAQNPRTVLKTDFTVKATKQKLTVYNLHLSPWATNNARVSQIVHTLSDLEIYKRNNVLIAGDFNYPYGRKRFEVLIQQYGLKEATHNIFYTLEQGFLKYFSIKLKLDYILYKDIKLIETKRITTHHSDHFPILSMFQI